ncbi:TonB-dependent receptor plug domain-containing protein [Marinomonas ostreistagni]|uniref:TonB-dependent receptor plug domain-containing protein n=1 Tax=Marinomonas ostreistagni TaxID=359209 RepID=UPI001951B520|nr:TonB-dependent receptor plug domain-containing protein [Marinomonas ostreistagni]MBM6551078.1 TonB-dependent receptor plug domain-containing protein [Marinomonas ostreistagni]
MLLTPSLITQCIKHHKALLLTAAIGFASSAAQASGSLSEAHQYDIAPGNLAAALNQFANQTGIYLSSSDAANLHGRITQGYQGTQSGLATLKLLLQGTGLSYQSTTQGHLIIVPTQQKGSLSLSTLMIEAKRQQQTSGQQTITSEQIETMAGTTGSMTSLFRSNPNVNYSRSASLSGNAATLRPEEIAIHGQASYQNAYLIDGVSSNNDLNPGDNQDTFSNPINPANLSMLGGSSSQGYYVDPEALEEVTVYDNNIPAQFGGFTGGVVDAKLRRFAGESFTSIKYGLEDSKYDSIHGSQDDQEDFAEGDSFEGSYIPDYLKQRVSLTSVQKINDRLSGSLTMSRAQSEFEQHYRNNSGRGEVVNIDNKDQIDNVMARLDYIATDRMDLGASLKYSQRRYNGITSDSFDDPFERDHTGYGVSLDSTYYFDSSQLKTTLGFDRNYDSLDSASAISEYHPTESFYNRSNYSGGYGDVRQQQDRYSLALDWQQDAKDWGNTRHTWNAGVQLEANEAFYQVEDDIINSIYRCRSGSANDGCDDANGDGERDSADEYLFNRAVTAKNRASEHYQSYGLYVEDQINIDNWQVTLGARADQETLLDNLNLSPRANVEWDTFGDRSTVLTAGASRYYGRSFFRYAINDTLRSWRVQERYNADGSLRRITTHEDRSLEDYDLNTPYSDELVLSVAQRMGPVEVTLEGVRRDSEDGVQRRRNDDGLYYYTNEGRSDHQSISLSLETLEGFQLGNSKTYITSSIAWQESTSNSQSEDNYDENYGDDAIYYHGRVSDRSELPAWDFNVPFRFNFATRTDIPSWNLTWANALHLHAGGDVAIDSREDIDVNGYSYDIYDDVSFDDYVTVDTKITWRPQLTADVDGYLQVGINNVFDEVINVALNEDDYSYTVGRSFAFEVGMRF